LGCVLGSVKGFRASCVDVVACFAGLLRLVRSNGVKELVLTKACDVGVAYFFYTHGMLAAGLKALIAIAIGQGKNTATGFIVLFRIVSSIKN
jgi:hypothetical protein